MLSGKEKDGIRAILDKLQSDDLFSLTFTVTKGFIKPEHKDEAVQAVLLYCEKPSLLLRRKKVKKEIIFNYLRDEGVVVSVSGEKSDYVKACLQHWESAENLLNDRMDDSDDFIVTKVYEFQRYEEQVFTSYNSSGPIQASPYDSVCSLHPKEVSNMGQSFVLWFYKLLNQTSLGSTSEEHFGVHVLMPDCSMSWWIQDVQGMFNGTVNSANEVVQALNHIVCCNALLLEPGVEGIVSAYDPYGIVRVKVGGVVHRMNSSIGLFEQVFGLFRDPQQRDCWKIKLTDLRMQVNLCFQELSMPFF